MTEIKAKTVTIATHNGAFHADDVMGCAILQTVFPNNKLVRTRDMAIIAQADFAVDVGGEWDDERGRYDHHQKGFSGARADGRVYASAGLVWYSFGLEFIRAIDNNVSNADAEFIKEAIDQDLMQYLDMEDTGAGRAAQGCFGLSALISQLVPGWTEDAHLSRLEADVLRLTRFKEAVSIAQAFLRALVTKKVGQSRAQSIVRRSPRLFDGKVLFISAGGMPWTKVVCNEMPDVLFVVYPDSSDDQCQIRTVPVEADSFKARLDLPAAWAGLRDADLAAVTNVPDAVFCHNGRFIAGARSKEGALEMVRQALEAVSVA